jgi:hypothetical protein
MALLMIIAVAGQTASVGFLPCQILEADDLCNVTTRRDML